MSQVPRYLPNVFIERSFSFKTFVIIFGALLLLTSTLMRSEYPLAWIPVFIAGALVEWLIVATVYVEINAIEEDIRRSEEEIRKAMEDLKEIEKEVNDTQREIEETKDDLFSSISESQGGISTLEDRIKDLESEVGIGRYGSGRNSLRTRVDKIEDTINRI